MSTEVDPLRSTSDHLALDPRARSDRPYLITMLRRLGYSEAEIAAYLGEAQPEPEPTPEPTPEPLPALPPEEDDDAERVIELEYTGPGLRDFRLVVPADGTEFDLEDPHGLGAGLEAGEEVLEGDPDDDELEAFLSGEGAVSFDDEFADDDDLPVAEADSDNDEVMVRDMDEDLGGGDDDERVTFDDDGELESIEGNPDDDEGFDPEMDPSNPVGEGIEAQVGTHVVEFRGVPVKTGKVRPLTDEEREALGAQDALDAALQAGWSADDVNVPDPMEGVEDADMPEWPELPDTDDGAEGDAYQYGDWLLHSREQQRADGSWHRVYFFAQGRSPNGEPAAMPEGYTVGVSERTGLPYLRRAEEGEVAPESDAPDEPAPQEWQEVSDGPLPEASHMGEADQSGLPAGAPGETVQEAAARRKRVKMRRIQASTPEEAEEMLRKEGRNVLGSMPVDIQEHEEDDS